MGSILIRKEAAEIEDDANRLAIGNVSRVAAVRKK
jgi:hypothetical protein